MGGGRKIDMKRISRSINGSVSFSKARSAILRRARELNLLFDADVSLVVFSDKGELFEFCTPSTAMEKMFDRYAQVSGIDLRSVRHNEMQNQLNEMNEVSSNLEKEIRKMTGEDINGLSIMELCGLEHKLEKSLRIVRERKYRRIALETDTCKKKLKYLDANRAKLLCTLESQGQEINNGSGSNKWDYESEVGGGVNTAFAEQPTQPIPHEIRSELRWGVHTSLPEQPNQPNLYEIGNGIRDLRLA